MGQRALAFQNPAPCLQVGSSTIKDVLWPRAVQIPDENLLNRPKGTIVVFKFPVANNTYAIKAFVFN
jgi:hypothetical protein